MTRSNIELLVDMVIGAGIIGLTIYVILCSTGCATEMTDAIRRDSVRGQYLACTKVSRGVLGEFKCWEDARYSCKAFRLEADCGDYR